MRDDLVFLTGAGGFVGGHVLRELLAAGYRVRALARGSARFEGCETVTGDLERPGDLAPALDGCRYLIHCAALYSFAPADRPAMQRVNVGGTESILAAARVAGVERAVVTSSSATVGPAHGAQPATEEDQAAAAGHSASSSYHASKLEQEHVALRARVPTVLLLPSAPVGPADAKPTPTGRMILDFARGRMVVRPPTGGLNLVPVEDVAHAHVTALEQGRPGERYLLGGENLSLDAVWALLAEITGRPLPKHRIAAPLAYAVAYGDELRCRLLPKSTPFAPLEGLRMAYETMYIDCSKAQSELQYQAGPVRDALARSVAWFREHNYVEPSRVA